MTTSILYSFQEPTDRPPTPRGFGRAQVMSTGTLAPAFTAPLSTLRENSPHSVNSGEGAISKVPLPAPARPSLTSEHPTRILLTCERAPAGAAGAAPLPFAGAAPESASE